MASNAVFLYVELGQAKFFKDVDWKEINHGMKQYDGLLSKTYLQGLDDQSLGGFYHFDCRMNAEKYIAGFLKPLAKRSNITLTCKLFETNLTREASKEMNSPFFKSKL